jgi:hypothetical protein
MPPTNTLPAQASSKATQRMQELMAQTKANQASAASQRASAAPQKPAMAPGQADRVAPKVQPHQDASSIFSRGMDKIKQATGVAAVEKALNSAVPKPKRNTRGW